MLSRPHAWFVLPLAILLAPPRGEAAAAPQDASSQAEAASWLGKIASADAATASRAEAALVKLGPAATPAIASWISGARRVDAAVPRVLRVIGRVKDPAAMRILLLEWEHDASRDLLVDTWEAFGEASLSPLAGYLADADPSRIERIVGALGRVGQPAVPALQGLRERLSADQSSVAERLVALIDEALLTAPVVSLARKGRVAWHDLETLAGDPATNPRIAARAARGLMAITDGDEAPQALQRLSRMPLTPELHALIDPAADDARLIQVSRRGSDAISEYGAIVRDASSREGLRMGAANALFGMGRPALPELDQSASALPAGELRAYVKGLADSLRGMPVGQGVPTGALEQQAPAGAAAASPCLGDAGFHELARVDRTAAPVSPAWFRRSPDRTRILFTTVEKGMYQLVEIRVDGTGRRAIAPFAHQLAPSWSGDGREVAFLAARSPIGSPRDYVDVYVGPSTGDAGAGSFARVTQAPGPYAAPVWLPGRREILYAANTLESPADGGAGQTSSLLFRHDLAGNRGAPLAALEGRIITAIEASPNGRHVAFLSWKVDEPGAGALHLHVIEPGGASPLEMLLAAAEPAPGRRFDAGGAILRGGDLTWTADSARLTAAGRIVDVVPWRLAALAGTGDDRQSTSAASRTFLTEAPAGGFCSWYDDTRQIMRRCPGDRVPQPVADCRGALLWFDAADRQFGLFDPLYGVLGVVRLPAERVPAARPTGAP